jgi:putative inorganic carbon (hco3(-)) transporter
MRTFTRNNKNWNPDCNMTTLPDAFSETVDGNSPAKSWFFFTILFLIIDYGRPQDTFRVIGYIRPAMIVVLILIIYLVRNWRLVPRKIPQITLIWFFILILALHIPFARNNRFAFNTTNTMLLAMPFILSTFTCINTFARLRTIFIVAICLMTFQSLFAIAHGGHGSGSVFLDENDLALFVNTWLPFSFALFLMEKKILGKILLALCALLGIGATVISFSRGGFIGLVAMAVVFWIFSTRKILMIVLSVFGIVAVGLVLMMASQGRIAHQKKSSYWQEMASSTDASHGTARERIESWKAGWRMFLANPLGVGGNNYQVRFPDYQDNTYFKRGMWGRVAHSLWFTLLPETGFPGAIIYLVLLFFNVKTALRLRKGSPFLPVEQVRFYKEISVAFLASFAGFFSSATFLAVLYYPHYWYLTGLLVAVSLVSTTDGAVPDQVCEEALSV